MVRGARHRSGHTPANLPRDVGTGRGGRGVRRGLETMEISDSPPNSGRKPWTRTLSEPILLSTNRPPGRCTSRTLHQASRRDSDSDGAGHTGPSPLGKREWVLPPETEIPPAPATLSPLDGPHKDGTSTWAQPTIEPSNGHHHNKKMSMSQRETTHTSQRNSDGIILNRLDKHVPSSPVS
jgi:hypothetical protein